MYAPKPWKLSFTKPHAKQPTTLSFKNHSRFSERVFDIMACYGKLTQIYIGTYKSMTEIKRGQTFTMNIADQDLTIFSGVDNNLLSCNFEYQSAKP